MRLFRFNVERFDDNLSILIYCCLLNCIVFTHHRYVKFYEPMISPNYKLLGLVIAAALLYSLWRLSLGPRTLKLADFHEVYEMELLKEESVPVPLAPGKTETVHVHCKEMAPSVSKPPELEGKTEILLLHGKKFSSQTWLDLSTLKVLAERGHRVVAVDLPGFGRSEPATSLDWADDDGFTRREEFLQSLISTLKLRRPAIVSPSMSGAFSLPLLVHRPDLVGAYVPVAPVFTPKFPSELYMRTRVPTLIVVGDLDTNLGVISVKNLKNLPLHKVLTLPNSRHPAYLDQPDMFHDNVIEFLKNLDNPAYFT